MKKLLLFLVSAVLIVAGGMFLQSCENETDRIGIEEFASSLRPICISEIPEGIVPMEFRNMREAKAFFEKLDREREKNPLPVKVQHVGEQGQIEFSNAPRLRSGIEHFSQTHPLDFTMSLVVVLSVDIIRGGPIKVTSSLTGFTLGADWEQLSASANWNRGCISYSVHGIEKWYFGIGSFRYVWYRIHRHVGGVICPF